MENNVQTQNTITLESLIGLHELDAVDRGSVKMKIYEWGEAEDCDFISFRLDGVTYTAIENPSDGYRSSMRTLLIENMKVKNKFPAIKVMGIKKESLDYIGHDTLQLYDIVTGKPVLEVGTGNCDDYYPYFVANFIPENMATNRKAGS